MLLQTQVGQQGPNGIGVFSALRGGKLGDAIVSELHGRFYEQNYNGNLFSTGNATAQAIVAATYNTSTLGATATPIVGVWNPVGSGKNLVILQARIQGILTASTATGVGALVWCVSNGNGAITTGNAPFNRLTLQQTGSVAKGFFGGAALTGLTNNLVAMEASGLGIGPAGNYSQVGTAVGFPQSEPNNSIDIIEGALIVPPGGVLALLGVTSPAVALAASTSLLWEEVFV